MLKKQISSGNPFLIDFPEDPNINDIMELLNLEGKNSKNLWDYALSITKKYVGNKIYLRGLIEYSNICRKNCLYCGLRKDNKKLTRYVLSDDEIVEAAIFAYKNGFASIVIQAGERESKIFTKKVTCLLNRINEETNSGLGITLSLGEQSCETFAQWRNAGAIRYLLRIETSNPELYRRLHPNDEKHSYAKRLKAIEVLRKLDYQVGTGVMIGLPGQTIADLANDLLFMKNNDIDMIGMGPYIGHSATPLLSIENAYSAKQKLSLSLKMIAISRIMMKDINIAATTALQTLATNGRQNAIAAGANVIMPNVTPLAHRNNYLLYENKEGSAIQQVSCAYAQAYNNQGLRLEDIILSEVNSIGTSSPGMELGLNEHGNPLHYTKKGVPFIV